MLRGWSDAGSGRSRPGWRVELPRPPRHAARRRLGRPWPVSLVRPTNAPDSFSRGARPACLTTARAVANRAGSPVSARIAAAPTADRPAI